MGKLFGNLATEGVEKPEDRLGGGYEPLPSGVYDATIKLVYAGKAQNSDAQNVTIHADIDGREYRETIYVTNRNGENFYKDKESGKAIQLPGFVTVNDIALFTTDTPITELDVETKKIKVYNFEEQKELPTDVPVFTDMIGKTVKLAILRVIDDKRKRGDDGQYHATGETRTSNQIDKVFHPETGRTVNEYLNEIDPAEFLPAWEGRNAGKDRDRSTKGKTSNGTSGTGSPAAQSQKKSLFGAS